MGPWQTGDTDIMICGAIKELEVVGLARADSSIIPTSAVNAVNEAIYYFAEATTGFSVLSTEVGTV